MTKKIGRQMNRPCPECNKFYLRMVTDTQDRGGNVFEIKEIICSKCGYTESYHLSKSHKPNKDSFEVSW